MNPIGNDYTASLTASSAAVSTSVPGNNKTHGENGSNGTIPTSNGSWISPHSNMSHTNSLSVANKIAASSGSNHWTHTANPAASCMSNMFDSSGFQSSAGHIGPGIASQTSTDSFGFVTAAAHANDLTKSSFYYASQFGSGIRGLTL